MEQIEVGDKVRHKTLIVNGGLGMNVSDVTEDKTLCEYFDENAVHKKQWFEMKDLTITNKAEGGFFG